MITFDKIVNKLLKKWWKVLFKDDIFDIIDPEKKSEYQTQLNKIIYRLKSQNIIKPIRNGVYIVPDKNDQELNEIDLVEKYYFSFVKKYITHFVGSEYFISGNKSLEIHLKDFSIPEKLVVVNRNLNKKIFIGNHQIIFKTISSQKDKKSYNLYSKLSQFVKTVSVENVAFKISNLELALVESAIISDSMEWLPLGLITKSIKKYGKFFILENFYKIGELKFIMSFNRLKEISKTMDTKLYGVFLDIIKKNGWLFIGEGLRKIY